MCAVCVAFCNALRRASGSILETTVDAFGRHVVMYDGIQVLADDNVSDTQTQGSASTCSSIYAVRFGMEGVMGLQNSELQVVNENRHVRQINLPQFPRHHAP